MMLKPYLIFDFDGTLVQSKKLAIQLFNELSESYGGRKISNQDIAYLSGLSIPDRLRSLNVPLRKLPALVIEGKREYKKAAVHLQPVEGIRDVLFSLKKNGYSFGILSSNTSENIQQFLDLNEFPSFDFIHSATNLFGKHKAITSMARKLQIHRSRMLYVGDEQRDVQACKKIGVKIAAVTWGFDSATLLAAAKPDFLCDSPEEFAGLFQTISL
ncbi:HAD-IA family hydrolase [Paenibacillus sp. LHD-38]|uniref:HAD-IA family hydrolase n=1 Tax=Paenibacillus sp. LHD-38 TaxID=3072143 RepID=UPI00280C89E6|nr:HAD-IA family hydrolase [Paenibacillus sp. LHD-38]MDQ8732941.1 HAD-IA family hydrolase [Paenibacillus sp. LHD-38]